MAILSVGILTYFTYRKSLGPPPTPPGKSPEFDQHLADIDNDWLFLFADGARVVVTDIYGNELDAFPDISDGRGMSEFGSSGVAGYSPGGEWAVVHVLVALGPERSNYEFSRFLIDTRDGGIRRIGTAESTRWFQNLPRTGSTSRSSSSGATRGGSSSFRGLVPGIQRR